MPGLALRPFLLILGCSVFCLAVSGQEAAPRPESDPLPPEFRQAFEAGESGFPLWEGYRWTYASSEGREVFLEALPGRLIAGVETTLLESQGFDFFWSRKNFVTVSDGRLLQHATQLYSTFVREPPLIILKPPLEPGRKWVSTARNPEMDSSDLKNLYAEVRRREEIQTPAGRFDALTIRYLLYDHYLDASYVPGIGFVKFVEWGDPDEEAKSSAPVVKSTYTLVRIESIKNAHPIRYPSDALSATELPERVQAPDGVVSLFADYDDLWQGGVVVYVVNKSSQPLALQAQDHEIYLKQETRDENGKWTRSETHDYSDCGNSYRSVEFPPGTYRCYLGWIPQSDHVAEVRYHVQGHDDLVSNVGRLPFDPKLITRCRYDAMALGSGSQEAIEIVLFGDPETKEKIWGILPEEEARGQVESAILGLARMDPAIARPIIDRFFVQEELPDECFEEMLSLLGEEHPQLVQPFARQALEGGPSQKRDIVLSNPWLFQRDPATAVKILHPEVGPENPRIRLLLEFFSGLKAEEGRAVLRLVIVDGSYSDDLRLKAQFLLACSHNDKRVRIRARFVDYKDESGLELPGRMAVTITNRSDREITFTYQEPSEIFRPYVILYHEKTARYLVPRGGLEGSIPPPPVDIPKEADAPRAQETTTVTLAQREKYVVEVDLLDFFQLPHPKPGQEFELGLQITCQIPGVHDSPRGRRSTGMFSIKAPSAEGLETDENGH